MTPVPPAMSAPLVVAGTAGCGPRPRTAPSWRRRSPQAVHVGVGDQITVYGIDGTTATMRGDRPRRHRRPGLLPAVDARPDLGAAPAADPGRADPERDRGGRRPASVRQLRGRHRPGRADHLEPLQRLERELGRRALLHLAAGEELDGEQRPAARAAARAVRDHRAGRRPVRHRQRHRGPRPGAAAGHRDAEGARVHARAGGPDAAGRADPARGGRGRSRAGRPRGS